MFWKTREGKQSTEVNIQIPFHRRRKRCACEESTAAPFIRRTTRASLSHLQLVYCHVSQGNAEITNRPEELINQFTAVTSTDSQGQWLKRWSSQRAISPNALAIASFASRSSANRWGRPSPGRFHVRARFDGTALTDRQLANLPPASRSCSPAPLPRGQGEIIQL